MRTLNHSLKKEAGEFLGNKEYTVFHKSPFSSTWIQDFSFDSLEEAEKEAERESRNNHISKVVDSKGKVISRFKDMFKVKREDNNYSYNMGVDDIEDIMASGLDWTQADFEYPEDDPRDYDDPSKLITIDQAEKIIGERPDASKPKPPASKNPRPDTIRKYQDALKSYKDRVKALAEWEKKFDRLVALAQLLQNKKDDLDGLRDELANWAASYRGTYLVRQGRDSYSWIQDPVKVVEGLIEKLNIPEEITKLDERVSWNFDNIDFDEDTDVFPSVLITVGRNMVRLVSIPDDLNEISDLIEDYVDTIEPKDLLSMTNAKLDQKSQRVLQEWKNNNVTNAQLDDGKRELKLYIASVAFLKEVQQLNKYPDSTKVSELVNHFLRQI